MSCRRLAAAGLALQPPRGGLPAPLSKRHDYTVVGNVELLTARRPAEEQPKPVRRNREPVAA